MNDATAAARQRSASSNGAALVALAVGLAACGGDDDDVNGNGLGPEVADIDLSGDSFTVGSATTGEMSSVDSLRLRLTSSTFGV
jgi:hypothetical protein